MFLPYEYIIAWIWRKVKFWGVGLQVEKFISWKRKIYFVDICLQPPIFQRKTNVLLPKPPPTLDPEPEAWTLDPGPPL